MTSGTPVAIVGIACRFPGAADKEEFWDLLVSGRDGIGPVPSSRWPVEEHYSPDGAPGTMNTRMGGFLPDLEQFDNQFFRIPEADAAAMDPQQRLLLQCAWHALEDACVDPRSLAGGRTGVYVGLMGHDWILDLGAAKGPAGFGPREGNGIGHHLAANRLSYHLDLRGPSVAIDTACSSSLAAVHMAAGGLALGECDYAIAGGVNVILTPASGIYYTLAGLSAPDGRCKPFSARADGMGRGEGVGLVVLRRLADAVADRQPVYAVLRGSAMTHNGRSNGLTAPARWGQEAAIRAAYERAGAAPAELAFVEAHGSGTPFGDAIEARALGAVHDVPRERPCGFGSVKGNLGHPEGAAGIAALIKAALALHHRMVPPSLHSSPQSAGLPSGDKGLRLLTEPLPLPATETVLCGVTAVGLTGTTVHAVLASVDQAGPDGGPEGCGVFTLSAPDPAGLSRNLARQADRLARCDPADLVAVCYTSNTVKASLRHRLAVHATSMPDLVAVLREAAARPEPPADLVGTRHGRVRLAVVLPGTEAWPAETPISVPGGPAPFLRALDEAAEEFRVVQTGMELFGSRSGPRRVFDGGALFCVEYALGRALQSIGLSPAVLAGGGVGAVAAACLAGALSLSDAVRVVLGLPELHPRAAAEIPLCTAESDWTPGRWEGPGGAGRRATHLLRLGPVTGLSAQVEEEVAAPCRLTLPAAEAGHELPGLIAALARDGFDVDWAAVYDPGQRRLVRALAAYAFADTRFPVRIAQGDTG